MRSVLVANPKGGSGKTTLATNLAAGLAAQDQEVFLWDLDRQQSSLSWLAMRPASARRINRLDMRDHLDSRGEAKQRWLVIDTPAGLHGKSLAQATKQADKVLVPIQPSVFDMAATGVFLEELLENKTVRRHKASVGVVGVRVDPRTKAAATLEAFLRQFELPILSLLRDAQIYPNAAFNGLTIFDLPVHLSERDRVHWAPILAWLHANDD